MSRFQQQFAHPKSSETRRLYLHFGRSSSCSTPSLAEPLLTNHQLTISAPISPAPYAPRTNVDHLTHEEKKLRHHDPKKISDVGRRALLGDDLERIREALPTAMLLSLLTFLSLSKPITISLPAVESFISAQQFRI
jgi:hypothetical protein